MKTWLKLFLATLLLVIAAATTFFLQPLWVNDQTIRWHLWRAHVQSKYVMVDGYQIHYLEALPPRLPHGPAPGKPLLLIHGLGSRGEDWSPLIPALAAQGFHVYVPDLLGYGRSPRPDADYSIGLQENTVVDFMQALGLQRADLGGWSMGGWVALKLTADHPALVDRLVLFDAAGVYFPPTFEASLFTPSDAAGLTRLTAILTPHPHTLPSFVVRAAIRRLQANSWIIDRSVDSMENGRDLMDFRLGLITQPTLVVWGSQDQLIPLSVGKLMHKGIPNSSLLIIDGCGHLAPGECSAPVLQGTVDFLKAQPPSKPHEAIVPGYTH